METLSTISRATEPQRQKCEVYTRVMGYHRPVSQFNEGKKSEFYSRAYFSQQETFNSQFCKEFSGKK